MSLMAQFVDGNFQTSASSDSIKSGRDNDSGVTSEAFLQLLVAEMQNQDPLEPTSNTEWISQYATFTEVSEIQEIANTMDAVKAQGLVGEYVIMKVTKESSGETDYVSGQVDYVAYENDDVYLSINGELYSIKDLDTVADQKYMDAYAKSEEVVNALKRLPDVENITVGDEAAIKELYEKVQNLDEYEKGFLEKETFDKVNAYNNRLNGLLEDLEKRYGSKTETKQEESNNTTEDEKTTSEAVAEVTGSQSTESAE